MKKKKEMDINNPPSFQEIGIELGNMRGGTVQMMAVRALENARIKLERKGFKKTDFFGGDYEA